MARIGRFFDKWFGRVSSFYGLWPLVPAGVISAVTFAFGSVAEYLSRVGWFGLWIISLFAAILTYSTIALCGWLIEITRDRRTMRVIAEKVASSASFNPLEDRFFQKRFLLRDLADPFGHPLKNKVFDKCELIGPCAIVVLCEFSNNFNHNVEFVRIDDSKLNAIPNKIILEGGAIRHCKIANVIFLVPDSFVPSFENGFNGQIPWINSPRI